MESERSAIEAAIKQKIIEIADTLGEDASDLGADEVIPATGLIDSAGLMQLVAWYDQRYRLGLTQEEITIDNLGTIATMARFVLHRRTASGPAADAAS